MKYVILMILAQFTNHNLLCAHSYNSWLPYRYFVFAELIGEHSRDMAFVVPIADNELIIQARNLYRQWDSSKNLPPHDPNPISIVLISPINDGTNNNYLKINSLPWSWSIKLLLNFVGGTFETPIGSPDKIESDVNGWINKGAIAFWDYFPIGELPIQPDYVYTKENYFDKESLVFGSYNDTNYPYIYLKEIGWIFVDGFDPFDIWLYHYNSETWFWTTELIYPNAWSQSRGTWILLD